MEKVAWSGRIVAAQIRSQASLQRFLRRVRLVPTSDPL